MKPTTIPFSRLMPAEKKRLIRADINHDEVYYCRQHGIFVHRRILRDQDCPECNKLMPAVQNLVELRGKAIEEHEAIQRREKRRKELVV